MERDKTTGERPDEIEITPEMLEAGFQTLRSSGITDDPLESDKLLVSEIYRAMRRASPPHGSPS